MSDSAESQIHDPRGPVHSGLGDQINLIFEAFGKDRQGRNPRRLAEDQLLWLWQRFVYPNGFGEARHMLAETSTVLLDGAPGSGRTSAARVLLHELRRDVGSFHELLPGEEGESLLVPDLVGDEDRLLLDLAAADESQWTEVLEELPSFHKTVVDHRAHLVVVLPLRRTDRLPVELDRHRVEIFRPRGMEVLLRHLRQDGLQHADRAHSAPAVSDFLSTPRPMREIAEFASLIVRAQAAAPAGESFIDWCEIARAAMADRGPQVAKHVATMTGGPQRALLLTTAMLHGAHADAVHSATTLLLRAVDHPKDDRPLLEHADLAMRLEEVSAGLTQHGAVRFKELEYDTAVRAHFWDHRPDLREHLGTWVGRTVELTDPVLSPDDRRHVVQHLSDQYLRTGRCEELATLAEQWTAVPTTARRLRSATQALERGLLDERHGRSFRDKIYDWSRNSRLGEPLAQVLVEVCAEVIAVQHPDQALVRLHHVARRERRTTRARDALCRLMQEDHRLRRRMLHRLVNRPTSWSADIDLFLQTSDPAALTHLGGRAHSLLGETVVRDQLIAGWGTVFGQLPLSTWEKHVRHWLHTACSDEHHTDPLLDILVSGAAGRGEVFGALYATARRAELTAPGGRKHGSALTDLLLRKISTAQGIRQQPPRHNPEEPTS
ncbi:hypothetical protein VT50_0218680 [Streptomyces antioxidans]|uniref:Uncharacterized protein n=1 Tax=Streptomyces antioxidans TaxID=1507734 RepID=A0A1V4D3H8_9ACTN|nr:hypothetical protein [Streptomyces antioxidans]OPF78601.1 hypothetical protein VT50_0218680 [Streptomyces antioxidans]